MLLTFLPLDGSRLEGRRSPSVGWPVASLLPAARAQLKDLPKNEVLSTDKGMVNPGRVFASGQTGRAVLGCSRVWGSRQNPQPNQDVLPSPLHWQRLVSPGQDC